MKKKLRKSAGSRKRVRSVSKRASSNRRGGVRSRRPSRSRLAKLKFWVPDDREQTVSSNLIDVASALVPVHEEQGCPYCLARLSGGIVPTEWPSKCVSRVRVDGVVTNVWCKDTQAAWEMGHHWTCPYWDHTDEVPF